MKPLTLTFYSNKTLRTLKLLEGKSIRLLQRRYKTENGQQIFLNGAKMKILKMLPKNRDGRIGEMPVEMIRVKRRPWTDKHHKIVQSKRRSRRMCRMKPPAGLIKINGAALITKQLPIITHPSNLHRIHRMDHNLRQGSA